jgi:hypothetical protein
MDKWMWCKAIKCDFFSESGCTNEYGLEPFDCSQEPTEKEAKMYLEYVSTNV